MIILICNKLESKKYSTTLCKVSINWREMVIKVVGLEEFYGEFKGILNKYPKEIASIMGKIFIHELMFIFYLVE